jgi:preprotein translocase subunit SecE
MEDNNFLEKVKVWPTRTRDYFKELQNEMRRVTWPNRKQVEGTTAVVILTVFAFAGFFAVVDTVLDRTVVRLYHSLANLAR